MTPTDPVGSGKFSFEVATNWEQLPDGYSHLDVSGVACDSGDRLFVFNRSEHPVIIYDADGSFSGSWGDHTFLNPHAIRIGPDDSVFCVDDFDHTVRKFTPDGSLIWCLGVAGRPSETGYTSPQETNYTLDDYRTIVRAGPPFNRPTSIAVSHNGDLYVTDGYGNARVHCFSGAGELHFSWGEPGNGRGQFNVPHSVALDRQGNVLVADRENSRIQIFSPSGEYIDQWTHFVRPTDLAVDLDGFVFVSELGRYAGPYAFDPPGIDPSEHSRVSVVDWRGMLQARWGTDDFAASGSFFAAHCVCLDSQGVLYVGEVNRAAGLGEVTPACHTLQRFVPIKARHPRRSA